MSPGFCRSESQEWPASDSGFCSVVRLQTSTGISLARGLAGAGDAPGLVPLHG